jgi:hypothetical protein
VTRREGQVGDTTGLGPRSDARPGDDRSLVRRRPGCWCSCRIEDEVPLGLFATTRRRDLTLLEWPFGTLLMRSDDPPPAACRSSPPKRDTHRRPGSGQHVAVAVDDLHNGALAAVLDSRLWIPPVC